jgi:predicted ATPase
MRADPALIGRDAETAAVGHALDRAATGAGAILLFSGEAGIGKTALLEHCLGHARRVNL